MVQTTEQLKVIAEQFAEPSCGVFPETPQLRINVMAQQIRNFLFDSERKRSNYPSTEGSRKRDSLSKIHLSIYLIHLVFKFPSSTGHVKSTMHIVW